MLMLLNSQVRRFEHACQYEVLLQAPFRKATIGLPAVLGESFDGMLGVGRGSLHECRCRATTAKRGLLRSTHMP
jgi:hypothetical protein